MKHGQAGPKAGFRGVLATFQRLKLVFQQECLWLDKKTLNCDRLQKPPRGFGLVFQPLSSVTVKWPAPPFSVLKFFQLKQQVYVHCVFPVFFAAAVEMNGFCTWNGSALRIMRAVSMMMLSFSRSPSDLIWIVSGQYLSAGELVSRAPPALLSPDLTTVVLLLVMRGNSTMIKYQITSAGTSEPLRAFHRQLFLTERLFKV